LVILKPEPIVYQGFLRVLTAKDLSLEFTVIYFPQKWLNCR